MIKYFLHKSFDFLHVPKMISQNLKKAFSTEGDNNSCPIDFQKKNEIFPHHFVNFSLFLNFIFMLEQIN